MSTAECPAKCSGKHHPPIRIPVDRLSAAGITDAWAKDARRCSYCGEVYSIEVDGRAQRRGRFKGNELMTAANWVPTAD